MATLPDPADAICARCAKPVYPGTGSRSRGGETVHRRCLARQTIERGVDSQDAGPAAGAARPSGAPISSALRLHGRTVLIVEDHEDSRDAMRLIVESFGATVTMAPNGREALAAMSDPSPDVILCDVRMPGMDGFDFLTRLRDDLTRAPVRVVAITGLSSPEELKRIREAGFDGHLTKPVDLDAIATMLTGIFGARRPEGRSLAPSPPRTRESSAPSAPRP